MTIKIHVPNIGENELEVTNIMVNIQDTVCINQPLIILEGDKTSLEIPASNAGIVKSIMINIGDKVKTGSLIMIFDHIKNQEITKIKNKNNKNSTKKHDILPHKFIINNIHCNNVHATPLIRHMARIFGINLIKIQGTGRKGRILREDVENYIKKNIEKNEHNFINQKISHILPNISPWPIIEFDKFGKIQKIELKKNQKISASNLHRNWIMLPHVTQFDEIDITELEKFRKQKNQESKQSKKNLKITPIIFIMKAVAQALKILPQFNSSLSENGQILTLKKYINIGIVVNTDNGLIIPVIRDVNKKNIIILTQELATILEKIFSSKNQLNTSDIQGGCFTISSLGKIGGTGFTPIINVPEVAILGVSKTSIKPKWNGKKFIPRLILPLALSYDHRVINGVDGAQFMQLISKILSDIRNLIM